MFSEKRIESTLSLEKEFDSTNMVSLGISKQEKI